MLVKVIRGFPYASNGLNSRWVEAGETLELDDQTASVLIRIGHLEAPKEPEGTGTTEDSTQPVLPASGEYEPTPVSGAAGSRLKKGQKHG